MVTQQLHRLLRALQQLRDLPLRGGLEASRYVAVHAAQAGPDGAGGETFRVKTQ